MSSPLLLKGFEVEMYTGRPDGTVVGCAAAAAQELEGFVTEPDHRNLEYTTPPEASYPRQLALLLEPRIEIKLALDILPWCLLIAVHSNLCLPKRLLEYTLKYRKKDLP